MNDDKILNDWARKRSERIFEELNAGFFNGPPVSTFPEAEELPPLTMETFEEAARLALEARPAPPEIEIIYSDLATVEITYEELKFIPVYPCQMEIVKIGEEREYEVTVIDESKMEQPASSTFELFTSRFGLPPRRKYPRRYMIAHPSARPEIEKMFPESQHDSEVIK